MRTGTGRTSGPRGGRRLAMGRGWGIGVVWLALLNSAASAQEQIPAGFEPFEHLVGGWKGTVVPTANRLRGWVVKHNWAWKFDHGKPVAMTLTLDTDKVLKQGTLTYDPATGQYRLEG